MNGHANENDVHGKPEAEEELDLIRSASRTALETS